MTTKIATALAALVLGATILTTANAAPRHSQDGQGTYHSQAPLSDSIKDRTGQGGF